MRNGVVDLRDGSLRARQPEDMLFNIVDADFLADADTSWWEGVVLDIMAGKRENAVYLRKLLGYGITGETAEEVVAIMRGSGRNGKGVLMSALKDILKGFYHEMHPALIVDRPCSNIDAERAELLGRRIAVFNELLEKEKLKTADLQMMSGGDGIPACAKYEKPITIQPRHLCVLTTNWMPQLQTVIPAIQQRLLCISFPVTFAALPEGMVETPVLRRGDNTLKTRMQGNAERSQVLKWLVDGAVDWYASRDLKANAPPDVVEYTRSYFDSQDRLAAFLAECCVTGDAATHRVENRDLVDAYKAWADVTDTAGLVERMALKGFIKKKLRVRAGAAPVYGYEGLALVKDEAHLSPPPEEAAAAAAAAAGGGGRGVYQFM